MDVYLTDVGTLSMRARVISFFQNYYFIFTLIVSAVFLFIYRIFFSENLYDFFKNILPELFGLFITYLIIEYLISRRKGKEDKKRLTNLYFQIRREVYMILQNLRQMAKYAKYSHPNFNSWAKDSKERIKIVYPVLIAGNDLFSEYFYATLFRVIRDIEIRMDYVLELYPRNENVVGAPYLTEVDINMFILRHDELANFIKTCEYEVIPEDFELIGEQSV